MKTTSGDLIHLARRGELDVITQVRTIFSELPAEWLHVDGDDSLPVQLDVERVVSVLSLPFEEPELFWKLP